MSAIYDNHRRQLKLRARGYWHLHVRASDEALLGDLRQAASDLGQEKLSIYLYSDWRRGQEPFRAPAGLIKRRFGTWNEACRRAGLRCPWGRKKKAPELNKEDLIPCIRKVARRRAKQNGSLSHGTVVLLQSDFAGEPECPISIPLLRDVIGTWETACDLASDETLLIRSRTGPNPDTPRYTNRDVEQFLSNVRRVTEHLGRTPTLESGSPHNYDRVETELGLSHVGSAKTWIYRRGHFPSWPAVIRAAGEPTATSS